MTKLSAYLLMTVFREWRHFPKLVPCAEGFIIKAPSVYPCPNFVPFLPAYDT